MKTFKYELWQSAKILVVALVLSMGVQYAYAAWTGPTATPPNENTSAPINVSATSQVKSGGLGVTNLIADSVTVGGTVNTSAVTSPKFCIGSSCITTWPSGSGGTLTGSGSTNYLSKWTGGSSLGNSTIYDNGNVGIGTAGPGYKLDVQGGDIRTSGVYRAGNAAGISATFRIGFPPCEQTFVTQLIVTGGIITGTISETGVACSSSTND